MLMQKGAAGEVGNRGQDTSEEQRMWCLCQSVRSLTVAEFREAEATLLLASSFPLLYRIGANVIHLFMSAQCEAMWVRGGRGGR